MTKNNYNSTTICNNKECKHYANSCNHEYSDIKCGFNDIEYRFYHTELCKNASIDTDKHFHFN